MQVICKFVGSYFTSEDPIPGRTYTVSYAIKCKEETFFKLKEISDFHYNASMFDIIDGGIGDRAPKDYLKPSMPPLPPVIVGLPGT